MTREAGIAPKGMPNSFEEYLERVNPSPESKAQLRAQADDTPIIMLNLLRFRPRRDPHIYSLYGKDAAPEVAKTNSYVGHFGMAVEGDGLSPDWDGTVLPVYHRRGSYLQLQESPIYQRAIPLRSAGCWSRLLYPLSDDPSLGRGSTTIAELDDSRESIGRAGDDFVLIDLYHGDDHAAYHTAFSAAVSAAGGDLRIVARNEVPVLSEEFWHSTRLVSVGSEDAAQAILNDPALQALRTANHTMSVLSRAVALPK